MRTAWRGGLIVLLAWGGAGCESAETRDQLVHHQSAIDALERALGDVRRQRAERELVEQRLVQLGTLQQEHAAALAQMKSDLAAASATLNGHQSTADQAANELNLLTRRIEVMEAAEDDIVAGLQSLARNRQDLLRIDEHLTQLEQKLEALQSDVRQMKVKSD